MPQEEPSTSVSPYMNFDITNWVSNVKVPIPLTKSVKFPLINTKLKQLLGIKRIVESIYVIDTNEDHPKVLQTMAWEGKRQGSHLCWKSN